jgi:hypothetical protein
MSDKEKLSDYLQKARTVHLQAIELKKQADGLIADFEKRFLETFTDCSVVGNMLEVIKSQDIEKLGYYCSCIEEEQIPLLSSFFLEYTKMLTHSKSLREQARHLISSLEKNF